MHVSLRSEKHGSVLLKHSIIDIPEIVPFATKCRIFFFLCIVFYTRKIKICEALGLMHVLFLRFLNNMCTTDLFLLLYVQPIVFGVHIFTFHITIFSLFYDMKISIQAGFKCTRHPT